MTALMRSALRKMKAGRIKRKKSEETMKGFAAKMEKARRSKEMMRGTDRRETRVRSAARVCFLLSDRHERR